MMAATKRRNRLGGLVSPPLPSAQFDGRIYPTTDQSGENGHRRTE